MRSFRLDATQEMNMKSIHCLAATLSMIGSASTQVLWRELQPATRPPVLSVWTQERLVYDAARDRVVMVRMQASRPVFETWEWDGTDWANVQTATVPLPRIDATLTYDGARNRVVMFGGQGSVSPALADTWTYDGSDWTLAATSGPAPRKGAGMAFDSRRGDVIMFGGVTPGVGTFHTDTWAWNGASWRQIQPGTTPAARILPGMAFDSRREEILMFGGSVLGASLGDTWIWDGVDWRQLSPAISPPARTEPTMCYDAARDRIVLYGGLLACCPTVFRDTWEWDGAAWLQRLPTGMPRSQWSTATTYDPVRNRIVLFGGVNGLNFPNENATWVLEPVSPGAVRALGQGCAGGSGVPSVALATPRLPYLGDTFDLAFGNLPSGPTYGFAVLGDALAAPIGLAQVGLPGCALFTSQWATLGAFTATGSWQAELPVPSSMAWLGARVGIQAFTLDPAANRIGIVPGDAVTAVVGAK